MYDLLCQNTRGGVTACYCVLQQIRLWRAGWETRRVEPKHQTTSSSDLTQRGGGGGDEDKEVVVAVIGVGRLQQQQHGHHDDCRGRRPSHRHSTLARRWGSVTAARAHQGEPSFIDVTSRGSTVLQMHAIIALSAPVAIAGGDREAPAHNPPPLPSMHAPPSASGCKSRMDMHTTDT